MAQRTRITLVVLVLLAACTDAQRQHSAAPADSLADSDDVQSWLGSLDDDRSVGADSQSASNVAPVAEMIGGLEERLGRTPDDMKGWRLLAQSYAFVGDMDRARSAADRAVELGANAQEIEATLVNAHTGKAP